MATFTAPNVAVAGNAIVASEHNTNWTYLKNWLEGVPGQTATYPGVIQGAGGTISGDLAVNGAFTAGSYSSTGTLSSTGTVSLGATDHLYLNSTQHSVIGLSTGTDINAQTAGSFLKDLNYRANFLSAQAPGGVAGPGNNVHWLSRGVDVAAPAADAGNYLTESHRYSVYSRRAGEGWPTQGQPEEGRPESEYRLVINGSMAIRGDIIGHTNKNESNPGTSTDYLLGTGTRIDCQWLNVGANVDIAGELRVQTGFDYARIYMGNDYDATLHDYIEWNDVITVGGTNIGPGFRFVHNNTAHLAIAQSQGVLSLHAEQGWPTLPGSAAVINTTSNQLAISSSSIRFKEDVEDLDSEDNWTKLRALKPRTFRWKEEIATPGGLDYGNQIPEPGFIAEEVHEVAPDHVLYDAEGDPIVYREKSMLAMLVKAVQDIDERLGELE